MADPRRCRDNFMRYLERLVPRGQVELARDLYAQALAEAAAQAIDEAKARAIEEAAQRVAIDGAMIIPQSRDEADRRRGFKVHSYGVAGDLIRYGCGCRDRYDGPRVEVHPCRWHAAPAEAAR